MKVQLTISFKRLAKKLHRNQIVLLEDAIEKVQNNPTIGELKVGDLAGIRVHKFNLLHQLILLAYFYDEKEQITLLWFGSHENFYRDLKNQIKTH